MTRTAKWKKLLCVLLTLAVMASSFGSGTLGVAAAELELDIGRNTGNVTAVLSEDGVLTISGAGEIRDFTAETAPFSEWNVTRVEIGAGITAIGAYTFYNCGGISGFLTLPKGIVRIGDCAFSGDSAETAPKPDFVQNLFTEALVTSVTEKETEPTESEPESSAPQESGTVETIETEVQTLAADAPSDEADEPDIESAASTESEAAEESSAVEEEPQPTAPPAESSEAESEPTADDTPAEPQTSYTVTKVTEQEIGNEIFAQGSGVFVCSEENASFAAAMLSAGYTRADGVAEAVFNSGEGSSDADVQLTLPVVSGAVVLPDLPSDFAAPEETELCTYEFCGWTEKKDAAGTVRAAGSSFAAGERTDLYFIASWTKHCKVEITFVRDGDAVTYSVPETPGYDVTSYRWQTRLSGSEWEDLAGQTNETCTRTLQPGDSKREMRCIITVKKQQNALVSLFSAAKEEQLELNAVGSGLTELAGTLAVAKGSGIKAVTLPLTLPVADETNEYRVTAVTLPEGVTFVQSETELTADGKTFLLTARPTGDNWTFSSAMIQLVSSNPDGTDWKSEVPHLLRNDGTAMTGSAKTAEMTVNLSYNSGYTNLTNGVVEFTLEEYSGTTTCNKVTVSLSIEDITFVKQTATVAAGRDFSQLTGEKAETPLNRAVSALFVTEFYPAEETAENTVLSLYQGETEKSLPKGTSIVLADQSGEIVSYYKLKLTKSQKGVKLSELGYAGTKKKDERVTERLLIVMDFHEVVGTDCLLTGDYTLRLRHAMQNGAENPSGGASFTLTNEASETAAVSAALNEELSTQNKWCVDLSDSGSAAYWLHVSLYNSEGNTLPLPQKTAVSGAESIYRCEDGMLQIVPQGNRLTFDLSEALPDALESGTYHLRLTPAVRPNFQNGAETKTASHIDLEVTYAQTDTDKSSVRSLSVNADTRVLDAEQGEIEWKLNLGYGGTEDGDTMRLTVLKKVGTEPGEDSYTEDTSIAGYSGELTNSITLAIPQGQAAGTYRALVEILDANGNAVAQEPYNFIVK